MTEHIAAPRHEEGGAFCVAALYHFARFSRFESFQEPLETLCKSHGVKGTLLIAHEGINGT
ncbi:MAG: hypothetical protein KJ755_17410, partial [Alphaproteobacteria bacterium]|nr:hypothetical protein [Alphaproteobacteria bacterium]